MLKPIFLKEKERPPKKTNFEGPFPTQTADQLATLKEVILNKVPVEVDFIAEFDWTAGLIAQYIEREYGYSYSIRGITGMLDRLGLSYTRPNLRTG